MQKLFGGTYQHPCSVEHESTRKWVMRWVFRNSMPALDCRHAATFTFEISCHTTKFYLIFQIDVWPLGVAGTSLKKL